MNRSEATALDDRIPPGQSLTRRLPIVGEKSSSKVPSLSEWRLKIAGLVDSPREFDWAEFSAEPTEEFTADIHCVTSWSRLDTTFGGVRLERFLERHRILANANAQFARFAAYSDRDHDTSLPLDLALADVWLVTSVDGKPLAHANGGPLRTVTPSRYFYKSLKWLAKIEFLQEDQLGFWERTSAYHNDGRPWSEERFERGETLTPEETREFKALRDFSTYRQTTRVNSILKVNFRDWKPNTLDLSDLSLKACVFQGAQLAGADFSKSNLTLCRFPNANLRGARFIASDLEGADFTNANLANAVFEDCALSATRFNRTALPPESIEIQRRFAGLKVIRPTGLLESEAAFLESIGALV